MAASAWVLHDNIKEYIGDGTVDLNGDAFKMALHTASSTVATTSENSWATFAGTKAEVANGNGYTTGGETLNGVTWTQPVAGTAMFDCDNVTWTASGGSITARYACIYDDTVASPVVDPIVCHSLLDDTPDDVTATDGNDFVITINANGVFRLS